MENDRRILKNTCIQWMIDIGMTKEERQSCWDCAKNSSSMSQFYFWECKRENINDAFYHMMQVPFIDEKLFKVRSAFSEYWEI